MNHIFPKFWWILAARGALGIVLGLFSLFMIWDIERPGYDLFGLTLFLRQASVVATIILVIGLYALVDGVFALVLGLQKFDRGRHWKSLIAEGALSVGLGLLSLTRPEISAVALLSWIAAWSVGTGFLEINQARDLNEYRDRRGPLLAAGIISVAFGILVVTFRVGGLELIWSLAAYSLLFGLSLLVLGLRLKRFAHSPKG